MEPSGRRQRMDPDQIYGSSYRGHEVGVGKENEEGRGT